MPLMHEKRTGHVSMMTKEDWEVMKKRAADKETKGVIWNDNYN